MKKRRTSQHSINVPLTINDLRKCTICVKNEAHEVLSPQIRTKAFSWSVVAICVDIRPLNKLWSPTFRHDTSAHTVTFEKMRSRTSTKVNSETWFMEGPRRSDGWATCLRQSQELEGWTPALPHLSNLLFYFNKTVKTSAPPSAVPLPVKHEL